MKILLLRCNERIKTLPPSLRETNVTGIYPPLGLAYIAAVLKRAGYNVETLDAHAHGLSFTGFRNYIRTKSPEMVFFTCTTLLWPAVLEAAGVVKEILPKSLVGVGGPQLSVYPKESVSFDCIDIGIIGEGEVTILEIVRKYIAEKTITDIKGTVIKIDSRIIVNSSREPIHNLDDIPFPAIELFPYERYRAISVEHPFFTMITSRGCPYRCSFCSQVYWGEQSRQRSPQNVVDEMELYVKKYKAKEIILFDDTFTLNRERVIDICKLIKEKKLEFRWDIRTRVDTIDRELLECLKNAGCHRLHMGIESGSQEVLDSMMKKITLSQIKEAVRLASDLGLSARGYFMLGYPSETLAMMRKTVSLAKSLDLDWASFSITIPHPGTDIYKLAREKGYLKNDFWSEFTLGKIREDSLYFTSNEYNELKLKRIKIMAYLSFYIRPAWLKKFLFRHLYSALRNICNNSPICYRLFLNFN